MPRRDYQVHAARLARAVKAGNTAEADAARRDFYAAKLAADIKALLARAPQLTPEQYDHLRSLLTPPVDRDEVSLGAA